MCAGFFLFLLISASSLCSLRIGSFISPRINRNIWMGTVVFYSLSCPSLGLTTVGVLARYLLTILVTVEFSGRKPPRGWPLPSHCITRQKDGWPGWISSGVTSPSDRPQLIHPPRPLQSRRWVLQLLGNVCGTSRRAVVNAGAGLPGGAVGSVLLRAKLRLLESGRPLWVLL